MSGLNCPYCDQDQNKRIASLEQLLATANEIIAKKNIEINLLTKPNLENGPFKISKDSIDYDQRN
jgi:hypothetical protein